MPRRPSLVGSVFGILGGMSLLFALTLGAMSYHDHHSGAWFAGLGDSIAWTMIPIFVVLGAGGIIYAIHSARAPQDSHGSLGLRDTADKEHVSQSNTSS